MATLSIKNTTSELNSKFGDLRDSLGITSAEAFEMLFAAYEKQQVSTDADPTDHDLYTPLLNSLASKEGFEEINEALKYASAEELVTKGITYAAKTIATNGKKLESSNAPLTIGGSAKKRILQAIQELAHHNDTVEDPKEKWCITKSAIFKACGSNQQTIAHLVDQDPEVKELVESHNRKHGLHPNQNRKGLKLKGYQFPVKV